MGTAKRQWQNGNRMVETRRYVTGTPSGHHPLVDISPSEAPPTSAITSDSVKSPHACSIG